jgi:hypothetical protein
MVVRNQVARVFLLQHHDQPAQRIIEQRLVAPVVRERPQHRGQGARQIHPPDEGARCLADEPLHLRILHGIQGGTEQPRRLLAQQTSVACIAQPLGQPQGRVVTRSSATSDGGSRNRSRTKAARFTPMRSLLRGMTAVCGMGSPSGRRNSATTANQSARAPTMAASAMAFTQSSSKPRSTRLVPMNTAVTSSSRPGPAAWRRAGLVRGTLISVLHVLNRAGHAPQHRLRRPASLGGHQERPQSGPAPSGGPPCAPRCAISPARTGRCGRS